MIRKYVFGTPFETEAAVVQLPAENGPVYFGSTEVSAEGFTFTCTLAPRDRIYGLGENVRGINKRGFEYISDASDDPLHLETTRSLYGGHNFILIDSIRKVGLFFDCPARTVFDLGYTRQDTVTVRCDRPDLNLYIVEAETAKEAAKEFRHLIGRSYIAPKFAFGYGQSRWGYKTADDFREVVRRHREAGIPLDMLYMDIDYMDHFKDFTVNPEEFSDFRAFVEEMKEQHIHLVPIIDAGVKIEKGYDVYDEGVEKGYFCTREDGTPFVACVWPGYTHFPDVLNPEARVWFGDQYRKLLDAGIDGFWNDMCEPSIFFTPETLAEVKKKMQACIDREGDQSDPAGVGWACRDLNNRHEDHRRMFHHVDGKAVCHENVHNLFGFGMTRAAGEAFERRDPDGRVLMFSRSSYIGAHRYGGIWMGDNMSWWSHLKMNLAMLPSLNLCGFLYTGADLCGFGGDTTRDLALRWLALGVFTPLMRNHSCMGTRRQEFYQFEGEADFRAVLAVRYRLMPYLYSSYMKAALRDEMMFRPLAFDYPEDPVACECEDQLMLGDECMIAPVLQQNAFGRPVYLPVEMMFVRFEADGAIHTEKMSAGYHYIDVELDQVPLFVRCGKCIPVAEAAEYTDAVNTEHMTLIGYEGASVEFYEDDGLHRDFMNPENVRVLSM